MPIYEYKCPVCDHRFSLLQRIGEGNEHLTCERCGAPKPVKQFSTFASTSNASGGSSFATGGAPAGSGFT
ncbi:zinc ribbon domain-containing protein [candidate division KSB3 bacterium]|uniref:Zinc ribbon domain-containing protein n=1 Tax=candidate division KSB3 bacterium TaxID=2044937 RepID=A0A9D5JWW1_9BACT|nr:zinc ribbon domain-containing protein [candidate division KSB3 bacterium]MBD3325787.1 zinc ribbon domain-containing protein [candidate division KSB3 bacterium]